MERNILDSQRLFWESKLSVIPGMFGEEPSEPARKAVDIFRREGVKKLLELGSGQGRDTIFFAREGFHVLAHDYSESGVKAIAEKAQQLGLSRAITVRCHDVRQPLSFEDESFSACYSHMLYCMALTTSELEFLSSEIRRVLKPGALNFYTARNTDDPHYRQGIHRGEDMYEMNGFIVHFFDKAKVQRLSRGYEIVSIDSFEETELPKRLFQVILRKSL